MRLCDTAQGFPTTLHNTLAHLANFLFDKTFHTFNENESTVVTWVRSLCKSVVDYISVRVVAVTRNIVGVWGRKSWDFTDKSSGLWDMTSTRWWARTRELLTVWRPFCWYLVARWEGWWWGNIFHPGCKLSWRRIFPTILGSFFPAWRFMFMFGISQRFLFWWGPTLSVAHCKLSVLCFSACVIGCAGCTKEASSRSLAVAIYCRPWAAIIRSGRKKQEYLVGLGLWGGGCCWV